MPRQRDAIEILADHEAALRQMRATLARIGGGPSVEALDDLSDVTLTAPATGHAVMYDGAGWANRVLVEADITDLQSYSLDTHDHDADYAALAHTHLEADITDLQSYALDTHDHDADYSALSHTHSYLPLTGGTLSGTLTANSAITMSGGSGSFTLGGSNTFAWNTPTDGGVSISWVSNYLRFRMGGTATPLGLNISNYDTTGVLISRHGWVQLLDNPVLEQSSSAGDLKITSDHGWVSIGPQNTSYTHIYTDRARFAFNKSLTAIGVGFQHSTLPTYDNVNGSMRWMGTNTDMAQAHTSSSLADKHDVQPIDLTKSVFMRMNPIWFKYNEDHPHRERWKGVRPMPEGAEHQGSGWYLCPDGRKVRGIQKDGELLEKVDYWEGFENPDIGRFGFAWEEVDADPDTTHWAYDADGMKALSYEGMLPDFIGFATAAIQQLEARVRELESQL